MSASNPYTAEQSFTADQLIVTVTGRITRWARLPSYRWPENFGPNRTALQRYDTPHVRDHTGFAGYALHGVIDQECA